MTQKLGEARGVAPADAAASLHWDAAVSLLLAALPPVQLLEVPPFSCFCALPEHLCSPPAAQVKMAKVGADAAMRDYIVKPRLEYRTLQGVNGPLVILEVSARAAADCHQCTPDEEMAPRAFSPLLRSSPPASPSIGRDLTCLLTSCCILLAPPTERPRAKVRRDRQPDARRRQHAHRPSAGGAGLQGRRPGLRGHVGH